MKLPSAAWTAETPTTTTLPKDLFILLVSVITYQGIHKLPNFELLATTTLGDVRCSVETARKRGSTYVRIHLQALPPLLLSLGVCVPCMLREGCY